MMTPCMMIRDLEQEGIVGLNATLADETQEAIRAFNGAARDAGMHPRSPAAARAFEAALTRLENAINGGDEPCGPEPEAGGVAEDARDLARPPARRAERRLELLDDLERGGFDLLAVDLAQGGEHRRAVEGEHQVAVAPGLLERATAAQAGGGRHEMKASAPGAARPRGARGSRPGGSSCRWGKKGVQGRCIPERERGALPSRPTTR